MNPNDFPVGSLITWQDVHRLSARTRYGKVDAHSTRYGLSILRVMEYKLKTGRFNVMRTPVRAIHQPKLITAADLPAKPKQRVHNPYRFWGG